MNLNKSEEFIKYYKENVNKPVYLYGNGRGSSWFVKYMKRYGITIQGIVDRRVSDDEVSRLSGITICSQKRFIEDANKSEGIICVVSAPAYRFDIPKEYKDIKNIQWFTFDPTMEVLHGVSPKMRRDYYTAKEGELKWIYSILADDRSKNYFMQFIIGALTSDCDYYQEMVNQSQYFPEWIMKELQPGREVFLDVGAFDGDSITDFIVATQNNFEKCIALEPDAYNYNKLSEKYGSDKRFELQKVGAGSKNEILKFCNENAALDDGAHVVGEKGISTTEIKVIRIDDLIPDADVTYIKMDIEGMELDALRGAEVLIRRCRPKLAISVYHRLSDIIEIPKWVSNLNLGYKLYLGHYWNCNGTDTVLFAI